MRTLNGLTLLAGVTAMLVLLAGCETSPTVDSAEQAGPMAEAAPENATDENHTLPEGSTIAMVVHGMGCPLCAHNVDKQLKRLDGVTEVDVDLGSGRVIAHLDGETRPEADAVVNAVNESGFTFVRFDDE